MLATALATDAVAQCVSIDEERQHLGASIGLVFDDAALAPIVDEAVGHWQSCENYRADFPYLVAQSKGTRTVRIQLEERSDDPGKCGAFRGQEIVLYARTVNRSGQKAICGSLAQNLAHEIGHVLGLGHTNDAPSCRGHIMSQIHGAQNAWQRSVQRQECRAVGRKWLTLAERWTAEGLGRAVALPEVVDGKWQLRGTMRSVVRDRLGLEVLDDRH